MSTTAAETIDRAEQRRREVLRTKWEARHIGPLKDAFLAEYGVKEYKHSFLNMRNLLEQGGSREAANRLMDQRFGPTPKYMAWIGDIYGKGQVFDHPEFYGRDRIPLFLVGHPYNVAPDAEDGPYISEDAAATIEAIRALGMTVAVLGRDYSWYGHGSRQVVVYHAPTVRRVCGPEARDYPFATPPRREPWPGLEEAEKVLIPLHPWLTRRPPQDRREG